MGGMIMRGRLRFLMVLGFLVAASPDMIRCTAAWQVETLYDPDVVVAANAFQDNQYTIHTLFGGKNIEHGTLTESGWQFEILRHDANLGYFKAGINADKRFCIITREIVDDGEGGLKEIAVILKQKETEWERTELGEAADFAPPVSNGENWGIFFARSDELVIMELTGSGLSELYRTKGPVMPDHIKDTMPLSIKVMSDGGYCAAALCRYSLNFICKQANHWTISALDVDDYSLGSTLSLFALRDGSVHLFYNNGGYKHIYKESDDWESEQIPVAGDFGRISTGIDESETFYILIGSYRDPPYPSLAVGRERNWTVYPHALEPREDGELLIDKDARLVHQIAWAIDENGAYIFDNTYDFENATYSIIVDRARLRLAGPLLPDENSAMHQLAIGYQPGEYWIEKTYYLTNRADNWTIEKVPGDFYHHSESFCLSVSGRPSFLAYNGYRWLLAQKTDDGWQFDDLAGAMLDEYENYLVISGEDAHIISYIYENGNSELYDNSRLSLGWFSNRIAWHPYPLEKVSVAADDSMIAVAAQLDSFDAPIYVYRKACDSDDWNEEIIGCCSTLQNFRLIPAGGLNLYVVLFQVDGEDSSNNGTLQSYYLSEEGYRNSLRVDNNCDDIESQGLTAGGSPWTIWSAEDWDVRILSILDTSKIVENAAWTQTQLFKLPKDAYFNGSSCKDALGNIDLMIQEGSRILFAKQSLVPPSLQLFSTRMYPMPDDGDPDVSIICRLTNDSEPRMVRLYFAVEYPPEQFYYWPAWTHYPEGVDSMAISLDSDERKEINPVEIKFPEDTTFDPIQFYAAITDEASGRLLGEMQQITVRVQR
jgi:hypothetical protein